MPSSWKRRGRANQSASSGWARWNAVSKQATCGRSGWLAATARMPARLWRLMQGRQRAERVEFRQHRVVDPHRRCELRTAMHDTVAHTAQREVALLRAQPVAELAEEGLIHAGGARPGPVVQDF